MATVTWYPTTTAAVAPNFWSILSTVAPLPAGNTGYGWNPSNTALTTPYYKGNFGAGVVQPTAQAASYVDAATGPVKGANSSSCGDSFVTPNPYSGTFAAGAWTISLVFQALIAAGAVGRPRMRVWASANADGTSARELTSGAIVGSIINISAVGSNFTSTLSWSPAAITVNNEYLFFQVEWQETTLGAASCQVVFRAGSALITSTNLSSVILYPTGAAGVTPNFFGTLQATQPTAGNTGGWTPGATALTTPYYQGRVGSTTANSAAQAASFIDAQSGPVKGTGTTSTTAGDSFISPQTYTGTFAAGAWVIQLTMRATSAGVIGRLRLRVWASVNADGSSARELTSGALVGSIINLNATAADFLSALSWSPGALTLNNEFLFFQVEWQETTIGSGGNNVLFRIGTAVIVTTDLGAGAPVAFLFRKRINIWRRR